MKIRTGRNWELRFWMFARSFWIRVEFAVLWSAVRLA